MHTRIHRLLVALLLCCLPSIAAAQDVGCRYAALSGAAAGLTEPTYDLQLFRPAVDAKGYFTVNAARTLGHLDFSLALGGTWAFQPLVLRSEAAPPCTGFGKTRTFEVRHLVTPQLTFALGLFDRFQVGFGVPIGVMSGRRQICERGPDGAEVCRGLDGGGTQDELGFSDWGVGDIAIHLKGHVLTRRRAPFDLGALLSVYIPVSSFYPEGTWHKAFLGERLPVLRPQIILERAFGERVTASLNIGALIRFSEETFTDVGQPVSVSGRTACYPVDDLGSASPGLCGTGRSRTLGSQLTYGLGVALAAWQGRLDLLGEIYGYAGLTGARASYPVEGIGGVRLHLSRTAYLTAGAGGGVYGVAEAGRNTGGSLFRVFGGLTVTPSFAGPAPAPVAKPGPQKDSDGDGIPDAFDRCPLEPEDKDGYQDEDGCPDPDNDGDGIVDGKDRCPLEPEDKDGFEDQDGCPELDNDGDGIQDRVDRCPMQAEDKDGFEDEDGCPDPDNDGDGTLDKDDACVNQPGPRENRGCPDSDRDKDGLVDRQDKCPDEAGPPPLGCPERKFIIITPDKIELKQQIHFGTNKAKIYPDSFPLLDEIYEILKGRPDIKLRIEGHTDNKGKPKKNLKLSQQRAEAVRKYFVGAGIAADRISAEGFGDQKPIADNGSETGREQNRRTDFFIVRPGAPPPAAAPPGAPQAPAPAPSAAPAPEFAPQGVR